MSPHPPVPPPSAETLEWRGKRMEMAQSREQWRRTCALFDRSNSARTASVSLSDNEDCNRNADGTCDRLSQWALHAGTNLLNNIHSEGCRRPNVESIVGWPKPKRPEMRKKSSSRTHQSTPWRSEAVKGGMKSRSDENNEASDQL